MSKNTKNTKNVKKTGDDSERPFRDPERPFRLVVPDFNEDETHNISSSRKFNTNTSKIPQVSSSSPLPEISQTSSSPSLSKASSSSPSFPKISRTSSSPSLSKASSSSLSFPKISHVSSSTTSSSNMPSLANLQIKIPNIRLPKSVTDLPKKIPQPLENENERSKFRVTILNCLLTNVLRYVYENQFI